LSLSVGMVYMSDRSWENVSHTMSSRRDSRRRKCTFVAYRKKSSLWKSFSQLASSSTFSFHFLFAFLGFLMHTVMPSVCSVVHVLSECICCELICFISPSSVW
jgi:hypothetical protein